ncbi:MAG: hypothetical protein WCE30_02095 [Mycobacterium sp.]
MVSTYVAAYAAAWAVTALVTYLIARRLARVADRPDSTVLTSLLAGALWPIVIVGLVEAGMVGAIGCFQSDREPAPGVSWEVADIVTLP